MTYTKFKRFLLVVLFLIPVFPPPPAKASEKIVHVYYTGKGNGEIEPCGCSPKASYGGLKRRGQFFRSLPESKKGVLIETGNFSPENDEQGRLKFKLILNSMKKMGYDAIAVTEREKVFFPELQNFQKKHTVQFIGSKESPFSSMISKKISGTTVFVHSGIEGLNQETLEKPGLHILLVNREGFNIMKSLDFAPLIDLVIHTEDQYKEASMGNFVHATINKEDGQTIGHLTLKLNASSTIQSFEEEQILLSPDIKDSPDIAPLFEAYNREVAAFFEKKNREKKQEKGIFLGVANCKTCHEYFWGKWKETPHSWAWDTLVKREKTSDPDCVPCHTVGYDQPGGFISINKTPDLVDVQCEVCHGPGGSHAANFSKRLPPVNEKTCLQCHNEKHSPDFNYQDYFRQITH